MIKSFLHALIAPFVLLAVWQLTCSLALVSPYLLPSPINVLQTAIELIGNGVLFRNVCASLTRVAQGFSLSVLLGCFGAWLLSALPTLSHVLEPMLNFLRMTPPLAMIPLLILWFGIGEATQLAIIILASIFPVYLNAKAGLSSLPASFKELARSLDLDRWDYTRYFLLPAAFPAIITGIRLSFGYSWRALIAAELIAAASGLGYMIADAEEMQRVDVVITGIFTIGFIGWGLDALFRKILKSLAVKRFPELDDL